MSEKIIFATGNAGKLKEIREILKDLNRTMFVQCHQSFFVNMERVSAMYTDYFMMNNGCQVPISRSRRRETKETFHSVASNSIKKSIDE